MWNIYRSAMGWFNTLDKQEWLLMLCLVMVIGVFCMRGFGSRANY